MGITSSMITGLTGLTANSAQLDVVGNNIANVNTVGFKSSQLDFKSEFSQTFSFGSAPNGDLGGSNPIQVGMGVVNGSVTRDFGDGSTEVTGVTSNLAIQGDGFFIVKDSDQAYTRDGTFQLNAQNQLVNGAGLRVQGFGVDSNYNVVPGNLQDITIPIGSLTVAQATTNIPLTGSLNSNGAVPTQVSSLTLDQPLYVSDGAGGVTGTAPTASTPLSQLADASGNLYFSPTDVLNFTGKIGTRSASTSALPVTPSSGPPATLGDLMSMMSGTLGINTASGANGSIATTPGASLVAGPSGSVQISIDGNPGTANDLSLDPNSLTVAGSPGASPFSWTKNSTADGESVATATTAYDSLGTPVTTNIVISLVGKSSTGTTWQYFASSPDGTATGASTQTADGTGTLTFDTAGQLLNVTTPTVTIDRSNTGAVPTLAFTLDFSALSSLADSSISQIAAAPLQDTGSGSPKGTLTSYSIDSSGIISGKFTNGLSRNLGQVALATFQNDQGLVDKGGNLLEEGPNSGTAVIAAPGSFSAGTITSGALEQSNVDLSAQFVQLISASTGFSASSRVITTANQLLQDLLSAAR